MAKEQCPACPQTRLVRQIIDMETEVDNGRGLVRTVAIEQVEVDYCPRCHRKFYARQARARIAAAQRQALGLLSAAEIRRLRGERTQREMSMLLGIGEKTYTRWESEGHFQSEAFDRFLRLLAAEKRNWELLGKIAEGKQEDAGA